jgi:ketosteroid isomerase-like protein
MEATGHTTGLNFTSEVAELVTFRDGKLIEVRDFASHADALKVAGLREQTPLMRSGSLLRRCV